MQLWIENTVDNDSDFYLAALSEVAGNHVVMRANWHQSTTQDHLASDVIMNNKTLGTAHVHRTGRVTMLQH